MDRGSPGSVIVISHTLCTRLSPAHTASHTLTSLPAETTPHTPEKSSRSLVSDTHAHCPLHWPHQAVPSSQRAPRGALHTSCTTVHSCLLMLMFSYRRQGCLLSRRFKENLPEGTHCPAPHLTTHVPRWPGPHPRTCPCWALTSVSRNPPAAPAVTWLPRHVMAGP